MISIRRYKITVTTLEPLRIGGKDDPKSGVDNPVTKIGSRLVIPGPSLKGAYRNEIENYLITKFFRSGQNWPQGKEGHQPCIPATRPSRDEELLVREGKYRRKCCTYSDDPRRTTESICPVCYCLGAMGLSGFVKIPFLYSDDSTTELYSSRIDRFTKTVAHGSNRPYELVPEDARFVGGLEVVLEDPVLGFKFGSPRKLASGKGDAWLDEGEDYNQQRLLKEFVTDRLTSLRIIGGYKSKGFGRVKITVEEQKN